MNDVFKRTAFLEISEYPRDYRDCLKQAVHELMSSDGLRDAYIMFDIGYDEFIDSACKDYLKFKYEIIKTYWK